MDSINNEENLSSSLNLTISQAAKKWPNSKSKAFKLGDPPGESPYFATEAPIFMDSRPVKSRVKCLKLDIDNMTLLRTEVIIEADTPMRAITLKEFSDSAMSIYNKLLELNKLHEEEEKSPSKYSKRIALFQAYGFGIPDGE